MDVILDSRTRLLGALRRFRAGVTRLVRELKDIDALDPRFEVAADDLYREHVAAALQEIEELSREMGLLTALRRSAPSVARDIGLSAPVLALAATTGMGVEALASLAAGATGDLAGRAALRQREAKTAVEKNEFVFLYEAEKALGRGSH